MPPCLDFQSVQFSARKLLSPWDASNLLVMVEDPQTLLPYLAVWHSIPAGPEVRDALLLLPWSFSYTVNSQHTIEGYPNLNEKDSLFSMPKAFFPFRKPNRLEDVGPCLTEAIRAAWSPHTQTHFHQTLQGIRLFAEEADLIDPDQPLYLWGNGVQDDAFDGASVLFEVPDLAKWLGTANTYDKLMLFGDDTSETMEPFSDCRMAHWSECMVNIPPLCASAHQNLTALGRVGHQVAARLRAESQLKFDKPLGPPPINPTSLLP